MDGNLRVVTLVHQGFEDLELWYPHIRLREEGITAHLAGEKTGAAYTGKHGVPAVADYGFSEIDPAHCDGLLIPGGWAPDKLRRYPEVLDLVRNMDAQGKPIGQICHAGWVAISARIIKGRRVTSVSAIRDDMENAGGIWVDEPVVVDGNLVSSRTPQDLSVYVRAYLNVLMNTVKSE